METQNTLTVDELIGIVKRRRWSLILPALIVFLIAVVTCLSIDPVYRSTSTILIEEQEISRDYVMATVTSFAEQRLQTLTQRIMSSPRLLNIINQFNLYADKRNKMPIEEIVNNMRKDIKFEPVTSDIVDSRTGKPSAATIAFTVSYEGRNPAVVQQVANVLASFYLEENIKVKAQQTSSTTKFLEDEAKSVQANLAELEKKIAVYKEKHSVALPELFQFNLQTLDRIDRDLNQMNDQLQTLREKESSLQSQLASIPTNAESDDQMRLRKLNGDLINLRTRVSDEYPDVVKMKAEIAELEKRLNTSSGQSAQQQSGNPVYITLNSQLASIQSEIKSVKRQIDELKNKRTAFNQRIEASPRVEEGYRNLSVERNNTQIKYDDLMKKFMEAKVASGLEKDQLGERFTLINPAELPEKPVKPNIPAILLIGLILGIGAGVGMAALKEYSDQSVRTVEALATATSAIVLVGIPEIVTTEDIRLVWKKRILWLIVLIICVLAGLAAFHFLVMDLDVLWARIMRRLAL
ncbi:MAG: chain-length determining protein [Proteobacteria bacterium]|nr:chain-length determining protein [Pseudomonadota bacterium]